MVVHYLQFRNKKIPLLQTEPLIVASGKGPSKLRLHLETSSPTLASIEYNSNWTLQVTATDVIVSVIDRRGVEKIVSSKTPQVLEDQMQIKFKDKMGNTITGIFAQSSKSNSPSKRKISAIDITAQQQSTRNLRSSKFRNSVENDNSNIANANDTAMDKSIAEQFVNDALNIETPSFKDDENLKHEFVGRLFEDSEQIETQPMDDAIGNAHEASTLKEEESDEVEGFKIFCDDTPIKGHPLRSPSHKSSSESQSPRKVPRLEKKSSSPSSPRFEKKSSSSPRSPTNNFFGPSIVKEALVALGGKAPAVQIADWIAANKPRYLAHFGEKKKLRYAVSGTLSSRPYAHLFQKEVLIEKGIKKVEWMLIDESKQPHAVSPSLLWTGVETSQIQGDATSYEDKICQICGSGTDEDRLLLCDSCDCGYHMYCLKPNVTQLPKDSWFCYNCVPKPKKFQKVEEPKYEESKYEESKYEELKYEELKDILEEDDEDQYLEENDDESMKKQVKRKMDSDVGNAIVHHVPKKRKGYLRDSKGPTYVDIIEAAIMALGGKATLPEITTFIKSNHSDFLANKRNTWRNSVAGSLSMHFKRVSKDTLGRTIWGPLKNRRPTKSPSSAYSSSILYPSTSSSLSSASASSSPSTLPSYSSPPPSPTPSIASVVEKIRRHPGRRGYRKYLRPPSKSSGKLFDPEHLQTLRERNTDDFSFKSTQGIKYINKSNPVEVLPTKLQHPGSIFGMSWSTSGNMLATVSTLGTVRIWYVEDWKMLHDIRDKEEKNIEEFYTVLFSKDDKHIITAGKLKDRNKWTTFEEDNEVLPSHIKIFDVASGKVMLSLAGHGKEILCIKMVRFEGKLYLVSSSQDGTIIKWRLRDDNFSALEEKIYIEDRGTQIATYIDFVPSCGNKFFMACCDHGLKIFDFERHQVLQTFPNLYGYLCDYVKFVECTEYPAKEDEYYLLTRGVEMINEHDQPANPNTCHLRRLTLPERGKGKFKLDEVNTFSHKDYQANTWLMKLSTNGRYVLAPTTDGKVFVWNMRSTELVAVLHSHGNYEVRDILFHPTRKLLVTCADDSEVRIYEQKDNPDATQQQLQENPVPTNSQKFDDTLAELQLKLLFIYFDAHS